MFYAMNIKYRVLLASGYFHYDWVDFPSLSDMYNSLEEFEPSVKFCPLQSSGIETCICKSDGAPDSVMII